jgi:hypothetical protein
MVHLSMWQINDQRCRDSAHGDNVIKSVGEIKSFPPEIPLYTIFLFVSLYYLPSYTL